jgi:hypothetical protein
MIRHCEMCGAEERETAQAIEMDGEEVIEPEVKLHEYHGHQFCAGCLVTVMQEVIDQISQWSPADADEVISGIVCNYTDQAARLRHYSALKRLARRKAVG